MKTKSWLIFAACIASIMTPSIASASWKVGGKVAQSATISAPDNPIDYWKLLSGAGSSTTMVLPNGWNLGIDAGRGLVNNTTPFNGPAEFSGQQPQGLANPAQFGLIGDQYSPWVTGTAASINAGSLDHKVAQLTAGLCAIAPRQFRYALKYWEKMDARAAVNVGYVGQEYGPPIDTPLQMDTEMMVHDSNGEIRILIGAGHGVVAAGTAYSWWMPIFTAYFIQTNLSPYQINKVKLLMAQVGDMPGVGRPTLPTRRDLAECGWPAQVDYQSGGATGPAAYPIVFLSRAFYPFFGGNRYRNSSDAMPMKPAANWHPSSYASPLPQVMGQSYVDYIDHTLIRAGFRIGYLGEDGDMLDPETLLPTWNRVEDEEGYWMQLSDMGNGSNTPLAGIERHYSHPGGYSIALFSHWIYNPGGQTGERIRFSLHHHLSQ